MCEKCLTEAFKYENENFDALLQMSNLRILRKRDDEALQYMDRIYLPVLTLVINGQESNLPSQDILLNLSKNYSELTIYTKAIKLLDILVKINDEDLELWYLLAFNHHTLKNFKYAMKCLKNFNRVSEKTSYKSEEVLELEEAAKELYYTLEDIRSKAENNELKNNNLEESEENNEEERMTDNSNTDMNID
jgi:tetratricopeptide (TPR) repeat protein